jgi:hypothetical protein
MGLPAKLDDLKKAFERADAKLRAKAQNEQEEQMFEITKKAREAQSKVSLAQQKQQRYQGLKRESQIEYNSYKDRENAASRYARGKGKEDALETLFSVHGAASNAKDDAIARCCNKTGVTSPNSLCPPSTPTTPPASGGQTVEAD